MVVGVFVPTMWTFEFGSAENRLLGQEITLGALVRNHRVGEFVIAVVALQDPFGHKNRPYRAGNLL
jgi:hypothetical protein